MKKQDKLSREVVKRFSSLSYDKAKTLGITDEDLMYISEVGPNSYRISIRVGKDRPTRLVSGEITDAINEKYAMKSILDLNKDKETECLKPDYTLTVREGIKRFFEYRELLVKNNTLDQNTLDKDITIFNGRYLRDNDFLDKTITRVSEEDAQNFVNSLYAFKPVDTSKDKLSPTTLSNPFGLVNKAFNFFKNELKIIRNNPFDATKNKPMYKPKNQKYLIDEEIQLVINELENKNIRFRTLINIALELGPRCEEAFGLRYIDLNERRRTVSPTYAVTKSKLTGKIRIKDLKTDESEREVTVTPYIFELVKRYRSYKEACGIKVLDTDFIFTNWENNELIDPARYSKEWKEFRERLGLPDVPLKNMRHTAVTFTANGEDNNQKAVKRRFGWSKDSTVENIYRQSSLKDDQKLSNKFQVRFRNCIGASYIDLYKIYVGKYEDERALKKYIAKVISKPIEEVNFNEDLEILKKYIVELFPIIDKVAKIDNILSDKEVQAIFSDMNSVYGYVQMKPISV